jgi:hypothetical protein
VSTLSLCSAGSRSLRILAQRHISSLLACWVVVASLLALSACTRERPPQLLEVNEITNEISDDGGEAEISGSEFPAGRLATVAFVGVLSAPGREPRKLEWSLERRADSSTRIPLRLSPVELDRALQGAAHATFRGELEVAFAALGSGGPTLVGRLEPVQIDFYSRSRTEPGLGDSDAFRDYLGVTLDRGLSVLGTEVDSPASRAGLLVADQLLELDGVRLRQARDLRPAPSGDMSELIVARPGYLEPVVLFLDRTGFEGTLSHNGLPALFCLVAGLLGLIGAARPPRLFLWASFQSAIGDRRRAPGVSISSLGTLTGLGAGLALRALGGRGYWPRAWPSLGLVSWVLCLALFCWAVGRPAEVQPPHSKLGAWLRQGLWALVAALPILLGGVVAGFEAGGLGLWSAGFSLSAAGTLPLFRSPWLLLLGLGFVAALIQLASPAPQKGPRIGSLRELSLAFLAVFWVNVFLTPPLTWTEPVRAVAVAWGAICVVGLSGLAGRALGRGAASRFALAPSLGLSILGLAFYLLTFHFVALRGLPGLAGATVTFLLVGCIASLWACLAVFVRQCRAADPWI